MYWFTHKFLTLSIIRRLCFVLQFGSKQVCRSQEFVISFLQSLFSISKLSFPKTFSKKKFNWLDLESIMILFLNSVHFESFIASQNRCIRYLAWLIYTKFYKNSFIKIVWINDTYEARCAMFQLKSLQSIRTENDLMFLHKSLHQHLDSDQFHDKFVWSNNNRENRNSRAFEPPIARTNLGLNSPFYRMMTSSNNLQLKRENYTNPSIQQFKNLLSNIL
jgi:hypothetical protein